MKLLNTLAVLALLALTGFAVAGCAAQGTVDGKADGSIRIGPASESRPAN